MCQPALPDDLLLLLLKDGARSDAIKLYQEETGVTVPQARRAVLKLARKYGVKRHSLGTYADLVLLAIVVASILLGVLVP